MDLLLTLGVPLILLLGFMLCLSNSNRELMQKLEMSGRSAQIRAFGVVLLSIFSMIVYSSKK